MTDRRRVGAIDLSGEDRVWNWTRGGEGSCVYCCLAMNLRQLGWSKQARYIEANYGGGESAAGLSAELDGLGWDYTTTTSGDVRLLDWCDRTGRTASVTFKAGHMCFFAGWNAAGQAVVIDPNGPDDNEVFSRDEFLREWRRRGGWATALVATPRP